MRAALFTHRLLANRAYDGTKNRFSILVAISTLCNRSLMIGIMSISSKACYFSLLKTVLWPLLLKFSLLFLESILLSVKS